ncbi:Actin family protein [Babesia bovis T2Bo]|uniref:Actin-related, putative n=1 Tax=Babesia bovis TaxID=5865 RepID=A7AQU0_BABBO|nr:Actin family protein [Babesia bovis T2Bo]EDO06909.1 Actin family protein [Babesia bovis T2Bo]|eukprot:XP_001610477.1 actin-related [Babesia bovis T2Bo]
MDPSAYAALPRAVVDNGSGLLKFSLASSVKPPFVLPNCIGHPKRKFTSQNLADGSASGGDDHGAIGDGCYSLWEYFCLRPFSDGMLYEPNRQRNIWKKVMGNPHIQINGSPANLLGVNPATTALLITEPNMSPAMCRQTMAEMIFEDLGFSLAAIITSQAASNFYYTQVTQQKRGLSPDLALSTVPKSGARQENRSKCCLVLDCGFGATHSVPFVEGKPIQRAALRSNIGGSHLNAYLKNVSAIRTINLEFNELMVQHMKEESCYVSLDFDLELRAAARLRTVRGHQCLLHEYKLPLFTAKNKNHVIKHFMSHGPMTEPLLNESRRHVVHKLANHEPLCPSDLELLGVKQEPEPDEVTQSQDSAWSNTELDNSVDDKNKNQVATLGVERFQIPELLFNPQDLGLEECGIAELAHRTIILSPPCIQRDLANNILLTGGSTKFPGFERRLHDELCKLLPAEWDVQIHSSLDRALTSFYGARMFAKDDSTFLEAAITRNYYLEHGGIYPRR